MKNKLVVFLFVFSLLGFGVALLNAQTTHHKHKHKSKEKVVNTDSINAAKTADSMARIAAANAVAPANLDTSTQTPGLVADTETPPYANIAMDSTTPKDGMYKIPMLKGAKPFALPKENAYDIKFYKRIWRTIDLKDSVNKIFSMHGATLIDLIVNAMKAGKLIAYADEKFTKSLSYNQAMKKLVDSVVSPVIDTATGEVIGSKMVFSPYIPDSITKFEMKEDVYFDKVRGRMITQIISLAPMKHIITPSGVDLGFGHLFYLYYPQCRGPFASQDIYDTERDIYNISFDDIFIQRNFRTVIVEQSNPQELSIKDLYPNDSLKQKQESDRIERELINYKKNIWKY